MELRLLGGVGVHDADRPFAAGHARRRCVLAVLAMTPGQPVLIETLIDRVWGDRAPADVRNVLYSYVSRLRAVLAGADPVAGRGMLRRVSGGYLLDIDPELVDLHHSRSLVAQARRQARAGQAEQAAARYEEACRLWRATPLADLDGDWVRRARATLEQERLALQVDRYELDLCLGRHAESVAPLADLHAANPLNESVGGLLMQALYGSGRQADALEVFSTLRRRMVEELGDEPGARLRMLHQQVLRRSVPSVVATGTTRPATPAQLPAEVAAFTGREKLLDQFDALLAAPDREIAATTTICVIDGMAGVGKTALAVAWAHRVRERFPDGQLYVDLRGHSRAPAKPPLEVLASFLPALGMAPSEVPAALDDAAAAFRSLLATRRVLVLLDNAATTEQVRPLLPGVGSSMVLVTSRLELTGLVAREGAHRFGLTGLSPTESHLLLSGLLGAARVEAEAAVAGELADQCGHLPLALRIVAANLSSRPGHRLTDYYQQLRTRDRFAALAVRGDPETGVRAAFDLSYARVSQPAQRMFRLAGLAPVVEVSPVAAAAVAGTSPEQAEDLLAELRQASLLVESAPDRYVFHDLLREYAADQAQAQESPQGREAATVRCYEYYLQTTDAAVDRLSQRQGRLPIPPATWEVPTATFATADEAINWLDTERANLLAVSRHAADHGPHPAAWLLPDALLVRFASDWHLQDWEAAATSAVAAASVQADRLARSAANRSLATVRLRQGRREAALDLAAEALQDAQLGGWDEGELASRHLLGAACLQSGELPTASEHLEQVVELSSRLGWRRAELSARSNLAFCYRDAGRLAEARTRATENLAVSEELDSDEGRALNHQLLGEISHLAGEFDLADGAFGQAVGAAHRCGNHLREGLAKLSWAAVHRDRGEYAEALRLAEAGLALVRGGGSHLPAASAMLTRASIQLRANRGAAVLGRCRQARDLAARAGHSTLEVDALLLMAASHRVREPAQARACAQLALQRSRQAGLRLLESEASTMLASAELAASRPAGAVEPARRAVEGHIETGYQLGEARARLVLAHALAATDQLREATAEQQRSQAMFSRFGVPEPAETALLADN